MLPEEFPAFIADKIKTRETNVINKKRMTVKALPEFVKLFKTTKFISCIPGLQIILCYVGEKGKSHVLIRGCKKRSRDEFEAMSERIVKEIWDQEREKMIMQIKNFKEKISTMKKKMEDSYLIDRDKLYNLF